MPPHPARRTEDSALNKFFVSWLPALVVAAGGLVAWGAFSQKLDDTTRRVTNNEIVIISLQSRESDILQRLSRIETKLDSVTEVLSKIPIYGGSRGNGVQ